MKKNILYIALILAMLHLMNSDIYAQNINVHDLSSCSSCQEILTEDEIKKITIILDEARPRMKEMRLSLREKRKELRDLHYNIDTDPEVMMQLGTELQAQRKALLEELYSINKRIQSEVGIDIRFKMPHGRGCAALQNTSNCPIYVHHSKEK